MGVKIGAGNSPVFSGSEDDQILSRGDIGGWKSPFSWLIGVVSQRPAGKVHRRRTAIIDFNPIFQLRIFVEQTARTDVSGDIGGWKSPFSWLIGVVSQRPAGKVHRRRTAIIDFNPIFQLRIFVEQTRS